MIKKFKLALAGVASAVMLAGAPAFAVPSTSGDDNPHNKVTICHATKSKSNPYVQISVNANGSVSGHAGNQHQDGNDIIPPFDYNDNGATKHFAGQNWNAQGQTVFSHDCRGGGRGGGTVVTAVQNSQAAAGGRGAAGQQQVAVTPTGAVAAGEGGAKTGNAVAVAGLVGSLSVLVSGVVLSRKLI